MVQDVETGSLPLCRWPAEVYNVLDQGLLYVIFKSSWLAFLQLYWTGAGVPGLAVSL